MLQPVIIDNGTGAIKAGYAGAEKPEVRFPSFVGRPKYYKVMSGDLEEEEVLVGDKALEHRGVLKINYPISHGIVEGEQNWHDVQQIWEYALQELDVQNFEQHPVLLTEAPNNPQPNREKCAQIFFETFNVPSLYCSVGGILSLYATGKTTGTVLDSGDGVTCAIPIYEGFAIANAIQRTNVAGRDVTEYLQRLLEYGGHNFYSGSEMQIVNSIKEKMCYVSGDIVADEAKVVADEIEVSPFELPDGTKIDIKSEKFRAPEILFDPSIIGEEYPGVHEAVSRAIQKSDMDLRNALYTNILLAGGSTMFQGFGQRLLSSLRGISGKETKLKIFAPHNRINSTFIGASILGSLSGFKKMAVSRKEYDEVGKRVIYQKCF